MTDVFTPEKRSEVMSKIRSKSGLDKTVHNWLCGAHIRHEMYPKVAGNPDIRIIGNHGFYIFNDSCFWHRCPTHFREPKSSSTGVDWRAKIARNVERDSKRDGLPYRWIRIWGHEVRDGSFKRRVLKTLRKNCRSPPLTG